MKCVRFLVQGHYHEGTITATGLLCDEAGQEYRADEVVFLPPVEPHAIIGLALNYSDHVTELSKVDLPSEQANTIKQQPALFFKPLTSLIGHGGQIVYPKGVDYLHYEGELAVVIGLSGRRVREPEAMNYVKGYTIANDVTARDFVQNFYRPPVKAKGWDSFGPLGPWLVTADELPDPTNLELRTLVNGELRQHGNTRDLIYSIPQIIAFVSEFLTLQENDVILTGTPRGISRIHPGDVVRVEIDGIGVLENPVVEEQPDE
jgi:5-oxopent-3-ene-1,2,5-tricarboxylate decarboxylase/2-hydroxyhepta-2,4-diene-1,7-dioate isomerase